MLGNKKLLLVTFGFSFLLTAVQAVQQYVTVMYDGLGKVENGYMALFLAYMAFSIGSLISPVFVRFFGATKCFLVASIFYILFCITAASETVLLFYVTATALGAAGAFLWAAHFVYMGGISTDENRGKNAGFFWAIYSALTGAGLVASGPLIEAYGYEPVFIGFAIFGMWGVICFFIMLEKKAAPTQDLNWKSELPIFRSKTVFTLSLTIFATWLLYGLMVSVVPLEIEQFFGIEAVGSISALFFVIPALASYIFGALSDKLGRVKAVLVGFLLSLIGVAFLYVADNGTLLLAGIIIATIAFSLLMPVMTTLPYDMAPAGLEVRICGTFNAMSAFGITIGIFAPFVLQGKDGYLLVAGIFILVFVLVAKQLSLSPQELKDRVGQENQSLQPVMEEA